MFSRNHAKRSLLRSAVGLALSVVAVSGMAVARPAAAEASTTPPLVAVQITATYENPTVEVRVPYPDGRHHWSAVCLVNAYAPNNDPDLGWDCQANSSTSHMVVTLSIVDVHKPGAAVSATVVLVDYNRIGLSWHGYELSEAAPRVRFDLTDRGSLSVPGDPRGVVVFNEVTTYLPHDASQLEFRTKTTGYGAGEVLLYGPNSKSKVRGWVVAMWSKDNRYTLGNMPWASEAAPAQFYHRRAYASNIAYPGTELIAFSSVDTYRAMGDRDFAFITKLKNGLCDGRHCTVASAKNWDGGSPSGRYAPVVGGTVVGLSINNVEVVEDSPPSAPGVFDPAGRGDNSALYYVWALSASQRHALLEGAASPGDVRPDVRSAVIDPFAGVGEEAALAIPRVLNPAVGRPGSRSEPGVLVLSSQALAADLIARGRGGTSYGTIPANALPAQAIPSNASGPGGLTIVELRYAIPSNAIPSNAIPSNALPAQIKVLAIPSN